MTFAQCWCYHNSSQQHKVSIANRKESMNLVFANWNEEDSIYPLTISEIAEAQQQDNNLTTKAEKEGYSIKLVKNMNGCCKESKWSYQKTSSIVQ